MVEIRHKITKKGAECKIKMIFCIKKKRRGWPLPPAVPDREGANEGVLDSAHWHLLSQ